MKKTVIVAAALCAFTAFAQEQNAEEIENKEAPAEAPAQTEAASTEELQLAESKPLHIFAFAGVFSGYELYGNLVNSEPVFEWLVNVDYDLPKGFGQIGAAVWSNTDLTDKRRDSYGKAFNEWDFSAHWQKTFYFDEDEKWGLTYRTWVIWYYYPHRRHNRYNGSTPTTFDWNHGFELVNPYVTPYINIVHEYHESDANLLQFGLKKYCQVNDRFSVMPSANFVWRNSHYNWCFPTAGFTEFHGAGLATMELQIDMNYKITENFGLFAKIAYCQILDHDLRDAADHGDGADYSQYKEFAWGGIGVTYMF